MGIYASAVALWFMAIALFLAGATQSDDGGLRAFMAPVLMAAGL